MKKLVLAALLSFGAIATAQQVQFDYDRSANFSAFKTYQWVDAKGGRAGNALMEQNIKRAVEEQLVAKGLARVDGGGDLQIAYQVALDQEKEFTAIGSGPRWNGTARVNSTTIDVGKLSVEISDGHSHQLVWRGQAEKTLDIKQDPDKNYKNLQKAMAKLFKNYPPGAKK